MFVEMDFDVVFLFGGGCCPVTCMKSFDVDAIYLWIGKGAECS